MSELIESLEKSVTFLKRRYPEGNTLLDCMESQLEALKAKKEKTPEKLFSSEAQKEEDV